MAEDIDALRTFLTRVTAVEDVHHHMRRITFAGDDLADFEPVGPDTFLYMLVAPPGRTELGIGHDFTWTAYFAMADDVRPVGGYYTLVEWRPEARELVMHLMTHGDTGPASAWVGRAQIGDHAALWGPRTAYDPPADTTSFVLVADETGVPAASVIAAEVPDGVPVLAFLEIGSEDERQPFPEREGHEVVWLHRDGAEPGTTTLLADAVRAAAWPGGSPYVWGGGESRAMTAVRRYVRREIGLPREAVSLVAYWRHADSPVESTTDDD